MDEKTPHRLHIRLATVRVYATDPRELIERVVAQLEAFASSGELQKYESFLFSMDAFAKPIPNEAFGTVFSPESKIENFCRDCPHKVHRTAD